MLRWRVRSGSLSKVIPRSPAAGFKTVGLFYGWSMSHVVTCVAWLAEYVIWSFVWFAVGAVDCELSVLWVELYSRRFATDIRF